VLHVIATELHESRRIDRQLFGRCARQGDAGSFEAIVAVEDELIRLYLLPPLRLFARRLAEAGGSPALLRRLLRIAQARAERSHAAIRRDLLKIDEQIGDLLAFSGKGE
jgi:preprotein translocase subunit SecA